MVDDDYDGVVDGWSLVGWEVKWQQANGDE